MTNPTYDAQARELYDKYLDHCLEVGVKQRDVIVSVIALAIVHGHKAGGEQMSRELLKAYEEIRDHG